MTNREGEWVFDLYRNGAFYAQRSLSCGAKTAKDAVAQWERKGYTVRTVRQPGK